ncbi:MAG: SufE family protein [Methylophaga sp.]|nr:SufE family protein [Methylophaga sp.]
MSEMNKYQNITDCQTQIINDFQHLGEWTERYGYLVDLGRRLDKSFSGEKSENNRLYGCQASVWIDSSCDDKGVLHFDGTSDSLIVAGLMALMFRVYSNRRPEEIIDCPPRFLHQTGLLENLSTQRANGLSLMYERIQEFATDCNTVSQ